jgi:hypothetical protein
MVPVINRHTLRKAGAVKAPAKGARSGVIAATGVNMTASGSKSVALSFYPRGRAHPTSPHFGQSPVVMTPFTFLRWDQ